MHQVLCKVFQVLRMCSLLIWHLWWLHLKAAIILNGATPLSRCLPATAEMLEVILGHMMGHSLSQLALTWHRPVLGSVVHPSVCATAQRITLCTNKLSYKHIIDGIDHPWTWHVRNVSFHQAS